MIRSSGLVGLSPKHFELESDLFIEKMKNNGAIDEAIFSMFIGTNQIQSKITFGGYELNMFARGNITWHDISTDSKYWQLYLQEMYYTGKDNNYFKEKDIIIDSGTSYNLIPRNDLTLFINSLQELTGMTCTTTG